MEFNNKKWMKGYVTVKIEGIHAFSFIKQCSLQNIPMWNVKMISENSYQAEILHRDISTLRKLRIGRKCKLKFLGKWGLPFLIINFFQRKAFLFSIVMAILIVFILSNIIWKIEIEGVNEDLNRKMRSILEENNVEVGRFHWTSLSNEQLKAKILHEVPDLMWVEISKQGTQINIQAVEKSNEKTEKDNEKGDMVASKDGVIVDLFVEKGKPMVRVNDTVQKGDLLISSDYTFSNDQENEEEDKNKKSKSITKGEIIAKVWYKSIIEVPLSSKFSTLTGKVYSKYYLGVGNKRLPIWNFNNSKFDDYQIEEVVKNFYFLNWKIPVTFSTFNVNEVKQKSIQYTKNEAKKLGMKEARRKLEMALPNGSKIETEKVLHESADSGKVKLTLYFTVLENIAIKQPLPQGD